MMNIIVGLLLIWCYLFYRTVDSLKTNHVQTIDRSQFNFVNISNIRETTLSYVPTREGSKGYENIQHRAIESNVISSENVLLTLSNSLITGIFNTEAGGNTHWATVDGLTAGSYYPSESPANVLDNNLWTKYNNQGNGPQAVFSTKKGVGTGFIVTPKYGLSVVTSFQFATGQDRVNRDPLTFTLEATNVTDDDQLIGINWQLIYSGETGLRNDPGRSKFGLRRTFNNTVAGKSYRLIITSQRGSDQSVQYSEVHLYGNVIKIAAEYIVTNVQYSIANASIFEGQKPRSVLEIDAVNYMPTEQKMTKSSTVTATKTNTWTLNYGFTVGVKTSFYAGIPFFLGTHIEVSAETSFESGNSESISSEESFTAELELIAPPRSKVRATVGLLDGQADIAFTAVVITLFEDGTQSEQSEVKGLFESVAVYKMIATYYEPIPIDTESIIG